MTCTVTGKLDRDSGNDADGMIEPLIAAMIAAAWLRGGSELFRSNVVESRLFRARG